MKSSTLYIAQFSCINRHTILNYCRKGNAMSKRQYNDTNKNLWKNTKEIYSLKKLCDRIWTTPGYNTGASGRKKK